MARLLYPDVGDCRALVVDPNPTSRSILSAMLRDMGVGELAQTGRVADARRVLEHRSFDVVLCDYHFDQADMSGQDLLDELRRANLLPYSTVFVMVTGEASYARVAEAAEAALDSYLLKPHTASALEERLLQARHRKKVLGPIFAALEDGRIAEAARLCAARFAERGEYWLYAARVGAELYLRAGDHAAARRLYEAVESARALPWSRLGIARVELEGGQAAHAERTLERLVAEEPGYADAHELLGRARLELGQVEAALDSQAAATKLTPASVSRLQRQGLLAFLAGEHDDALASLERAVRVGINSRMFDPQTLVLLALLQFDRRDGRGLARTQANLAPALERQPESPRLARLATLIEALIALHQRGQPACVAATQRLADGIRAEDFDFEAATHLLALIARLRAHQAAPDDALRWVEHIALRFCVSKATTDLLCLAARPDAELESAIRETHHGVHGMAEKAMTHSLRGEPEAAVKALMVRGRETLNAKLIEMAGLVLQRHAARIASSADIGAMIADLRQRYCSKGTQVVLGSGLGRATGGLTLRA